MAATRTHLQTAVIQEPDGYYVHISQGASTTMHSGRTLRRRGPSADFGPYATYEIADGERKRFLDTGILPEKKAQTG